VNNLILGQTINDFETRLLELGFSLYLKEFQRNHPTTMILRINKNLCIAILISELMLGCGKSGNEKTNTSHNDPLTKENRANEDSKIDPLKEKGVGPVQSITLEEMNPSLAEHGKMIYDMKCSACHKIEERYVGPALKDITKRRTPEWIMNMILNPVEMTQKDPIAKKLLDEYRSQMTYQDVREDDARALLEYFRKEDNQK
jgi:mono/diheme cytochrome c family protein